MLKVTCLSMKLQLNSISRLNFIGIPKYSPLGEIFMHIPVQGPVLKLNLKMEFQFVSIFVQKFKFFRPRVRFFHASRVHNNSQVQLSFVKTQALSM